MKVNFLLWHFLNDVAIAVGSGVALDLPRRTATPGLPGTRKWLFHPGFQKEPPFDNDWLSLVRLMPNI